MGTTMNQGAYERLIVEDELWLQRQPRTLEREHVINILRDSVRYYYPAEAEAETVTGMMNLLSDALGGAPVEVRIVGGDFYTYAPDAGSPVADVLAAGAAVMREVKGSRARDPLASLHIAAEVLAMDAPGDERLADVARQVQAALTMSPREAWRRGTHETPVLDAPCRPDPLRVAMTICNRCNQQALTEDRPPGTTHEDVSHDGTPCGGTFKRLAVMLDAGAALVLEDEAPPAGSTMTTDELAVLAGLICNACGSRPESAGKRDGHACARPGGGDLLCGGTIRPLRSYCPDCGLFTIRPPGSVCVEAEGRVNVLTRELPLRCSWCETQFTTLEHSVGEACADIREALNESEGRRLGTCVGVLRLDSWATRRLMDEGTVTAYSIVPAEAGDGEADGPGYRCGRARVMEEDKWRALHAPHGTIERRKRASQPTAGYTVYDDCCPCGGKLIISIADTDKRGARP